MSISRRGLIAAGLAVAVVGTVGVASTLNAGAAQIAEPRSATSSAPTTDKADARSGLLAPPPDLPGGGKAAKGASAVQAEGGAAEDAAQKVDPVYAPKSLPGFTAPNVKSGGKRVKVPALGAGAATAASGASAKVAGAASAEVTTLAAEQKNYYSQAAQVGDNDGTFAHLTIHQPKVQDGDLHSLAEVAVRSADGAHAVEVGWTIDPDVNKKDPRPHLFVYRWANHSPGCYNGCGWVQRPGYKMPGTFLTPGETKRFTIQHSGTSWWIGYDTDWIGYFPDSEWGGKFTRAGAAQWFGEVALMNQESCTEMGNGVPQDSAQVASFTGISFYRGPAVKPVTEMTNKDLYTLSTDEKEPNAFRYGGNGVC